MSRIKPEDLPKPSKVSRTRAKELLSQFSVSGNSKYDVYVSAALNLAPGEALDVVVLPENVITSIQKKFREQGLTRNKGFYVMSKALGNEKGGHKSLLIGRYATVPTATKRTKAAPKRTTTKSTRRTSKATAASRAKVTAKAAPKTTAKRTTAKAKPSASTRTRKTTAAKSAPKKTTAAKKTTATKRTTAARKTTAAAKAKTTSARRTKAVAKKVTAKKAVAKKAPAKKATTKKVAAKKVAAKKVTAKKAAPKKVTTRKTVKTSRKAAATPKARTNGVAVSV